MHLVVTYILHSGLPPGILDEAEERNAIGRKLGPMRNLRRVRGFDRASDGVSRRCYEQRRWPIYRPICWPHREWKYDFRVLCGNKIWDGDVTATAAITESTGILYTAGNHVSDPHSTKDIIVFSFLCPLEAR